MSLSLCDFVQFSFTFSYCTWCSFVCTSCQCNVVLFLSFYSSASLLWHCWLGGRKRIWPVKNWMMGGDMVICLERGADLHVAQLMPLPLTVSCFSKIQLGFTFLVPADPVNGCVCVCSTWTTGIYLYFSTYFPPTYISETRPHFRCKTCMVQFLPRGAM